MLDALRDLVAHKAHASAALLSAIATTPGATSDADLSALLHHVLLANRFWLLAIRQQPFVLEDEARVSADFSSLVQRYARLQDDEAAWLEAASAADLDRLVSGPFVPGGACTVTQAFLQVCLHGQGHRAQAAKLLRALGGTPPATDFIVWLTHRAPAAWPRGGAA